jgi:hypothetical protein
MYAGWWLILLKSGGGWKLEKLENAVWLKIKSSEQGVQVQFSSWLNVAPVVDRREGMQPGTGAVIRLNILKMSRDKG